MPNEMQEMKLSEIPKGSDFCVIIRGPNADSGSQFPEAMLIPQYGHRQIPCTRSKMGASPKGHR